MAESWTRGKEESEKRVAVSCFHSLIAKYGVGTSRCNVINFAMCATLSSPSMLDLKVL